MKHYGFQMIRILNRIDYEFSFSKRIFPRKIKHQLEDLIYKDLSDPAGKYIIILSEEEADIDSLKKNLAGICTYNIWSMIKIDSVDF